VNKRDSLGLTQALAELWSASIGRLSGARTGRGRSGSPCQALNRNAAGQTLEAFANLTNDGDEEGALFIDRLPLPDEAEPHPRRRASSLPALRSTPAFCQPGYSKRP
jgi:hypothetical protein